MAPDITLYASVYSRSFTVRWMLAELGLPHRVVDVDIGKLRHKAADYLRINPMGKVPAITDGGVTVTENPAICLYLADRYGLGTLAPVTDDPLRGPYLRWCVFATAVFEPAVYLADQPDDDASVSGRGWGRRETVLGIIDDLLAPGPWILGDRFSTADVVLGSQVSVALFNGRIPKTPALEAYDSRIAARPAYQAAAAANWPPPP